MTFKGFSMTLKQPVKINTKQLWITTCIMHEFSSRTSVFTCCVRHMVSVTTHIDFQLNNSILFQECKLKWRWHMEKINRTVNGAYFQSAGFNSFSECCKTFDNCSSVTAQQFNAAGIKWICRFHIYHNCGIYRRQSVNENL